MHSQVGCAFVIFFIIGICTLLLGCNPNLDNQCIAYDVVEATVYDYKFTTDTCSDCIAYNKKNECTAYTYYTCYDAFVKFHYGSNKTCTYQTENDSSSQSKAQHSVDSYDIGDQKKLIKVKGTSTCEDLSTGMVTWIVGVVFLSLAGLVLIVWVGVMASMFWYTYSRERNMEAFNKQRDKREREGRAELKEDNLERVF